MHVETRGCYDQSTRCWYGTDIGGRRECHRLSWWPSRWDLQCKASRRSLDHDQAKRLSSTPTRTQVCCGHSNSAVVIPSSITQHARLFPVVTRPAVLPNQVQEDVFPGPC